MVTYRYNKIIKAVDKTTEYTYAWGLPGEQDFIIVTWSIQKYKTKKIRPMMGDDYYVGEWVEVLEKERIKFTQAKYDDFVSRIGKPDEVHHKDPSDPKD